MRTGGNISDTAYAESTLMRAAFQLSPFAAIPVEPNRSICACCVSKSMPYDHTVIYPHKKFAYAGFCVSSTNGYPNSSKNPSKAPSAPGGTCIPTRTFPTSSHAHQGWPQLKERSTHRSRGSGSGRARCSNPASCPSRTLPTLQVVRGTLNPWSVSDLDFEERPTESEYPLMIHLAPATHQMPHM